VFGFGGDDSGSIYSLGIQDIKLKLTLALQNNNLTKFDVIGFDACVMQSWAVLGELASVTRHVLASVALEPAHGWNYAYVKSNVDNAIDLAKYIIDGFVDSKHGNA